MLNPIQQLPIKFEGQTDYSLHNFIVAAANLSAFKFVTKWPHWGFPPLGKVAVLYGPPACGKTHLAHIWQQQSGAIFLEPNSMYQTVSNARQQDQRLPCFIMDELQLFMKDETTLLHTLNIIIQKHYYLLITSLVPPHERKIKLADLRSRVNAFNSIGIEAPDEELLTLLLMKHFSDRQLKVAPEVLHYVIARIERSCAAVCQFVERIDHLALSEKRNITIPLVKKLLTVSGEPENH